MKSAVKTGRRPASYSKTAKNKIPWPRSLWLSPDITGGDREQTYPPPLNLEKLVRLKKLSLWSFCDLTQLPPLPHIEAFHVVVRDPFSDTKIIADRFPNLKKLVLWGAHLKAVELPPEIADFASMEKCIPEKITEELLAYNLACVSANLDKRDDMLKYVALSIALGKIAKQFKDDPDFSAYLEDEDFRRALKRKRD